MSQFKLRAAWGAAGQQPGTFDAPQLYDPEVSGNDQAVLIPGSFGNPALSPERSDELEYGFDATLLDGRIELNVTRYTRRITDAIVNRPVPPSTGFPGSQIVNLGRVTGSGNELGINARVLEGQKFGVDVGFQVSTNQNRIEDLGGLDVIGVPNARQEHRPGFPVGGIFIKHIISAEVNAAGVLGRSFCDGGTGPTGLERGGPVVDCAVAPRVYWSPSMPTWQFGFNTTFTVLRNLRLYARIEGNGGHHTINTELRASHNLGITEAVLRGNDPLMLATRRDENDVMGLYDGSFAKLREVSLAYTLPPSWLSFVRASRGSITVSARNLMMLWTGAHGFGTPRDGRVRQVRGLGGEWTWDPEIRNPSQIQSDYTVYLPPTTSATVTVRLGF